MTYRREPRRSGTTPGWRASAEPGSIVSRAVAFFRGPTLPPGFASGNGRIEATEYDIATKRPTRLIQVLVTEGDLVEPGQVVVRMDTADLEVDRRTNDAQLAQAREDKRRALAAVVQRASDAQRQLFQAELELASTMRDQLTAVVLVYKALGGGW